MKKKVLKYIPFGIAVLFVMSHLIQVWSQRVRIVGNVEYTSLVVDSVSYMAIGLSVTLVLIVLKQEYWKLVFLGLVILAFTPVMQFYDQTFSIGIGSFKIEMIALGILVFHLLLNPEILPFAKFEPGENSLQKKKELEETEFENKVQYFEVRLKAKTKNELQEIIDVNQLIPEAIEAANRLLKKVD